MLASRDGSGSARRSFVRSPPAQPGPAHAIVLRLDAPAALVQRDASVDPPRDLEDEAYTLDITPDRALVHARHPAGLFYAAQTLAQLARARPIAFSPPGPGLGLATLPCIHIEDAPAFPFRAMHLDVARHFFTKELVERYVDLLSFYRFNVFHWHLTDDQGFRLSIRSHPELTDVGAPGGSYSQDDARDVVSFAKDRFVTVVPEIEMPGHARAILASHPELSCTGKKQEVPRTWGVFEDVLCAGNEATYTLLSDVLRETTEVFPSRLVHVGGDEVPPTRWNACPKCRARMAKEKLTPPLLQGAFMKRVGAMLSARGRRMVAWDEALDGGFPADGVVVAWQNVERGRAAAVAGHDVVMAPSDTTYLNFWQTRTQNGPGHPGFAPWTNVLAFDPLPRGLPASQAAHVLGGEGALWTEYVESSADLDTLLLPRLAALSDALWSGPGDPTFVLTLRRAEAHARCERCSLLRRASVRDASQEGVHRQRIALARAAGAPPRRRRSVHARRLGAGPLVTRLRRAHRAPRRDVGGSAALPSRRSNERCGPRDVRALDTAAGDPAFDGT